MLICYLRLYRIKFIECNATQVLLGDMIGTPSLKASYQPTINKAQKTVHDERLAFHKKGFCPHHNDVKIVKGGMMGKKHIGCWKCDKLFDIEVQNSSNPIGSVITVPETQMSFVDERSISNASTPIVDVSVNSELKKLKNDLELTRKALETQKGNNSIDHELSQVSQVALKGKNDEIIKLKNDLELTRKALEAQKGKNSIDHELSQVAQVALKEKKDETKSETDNDNAELTKLKNDLELTRKALEVQKETNSIKLELFQKAQKEKEASNAEIIKLKNELEQSRKELEVEKKISIELEVPQKEKIGECGISTQKSKFKFDNKSIREAVLRLIRSPSSGKLFIDGKVVPAIKHYTMLYGPIEEWDTSRVTDMSYLFKDIKYFNCNICDWDVSNVTTMKGMFHNCSHFKQDISGWKHISGYILCGAGVPRFVLGGRGLEPKDHAITDPRDW